MQFFKKALAILAITFAVFGINAQSKFVEGKDYDKLDTEIPLHQKGRAEVAEYFWYGCPHCYHLDPAVKKWKKTKPDYADFHHVPATGGTWEFAAKAKYTADKLGIDEEAFHKAYFEEFFVKKNRGVAFKDDLFAKFLKDKFKVKRADYDKASKSLQVKSKLKSAQNRNLLGNITSVPVFIVNGKYLVSGVKAGTEERMFEIINALLEQDNPKKTETKPATSAKVATQKTTTKSATPAKVPTQKTEAKPAAPAKAPEQKKTGASLPVSAKAEETAS